MVDGVGFLAIRSDWLAVGDRVTWRKNAIAGKGVVVRAEEVLDVTQQNITPWPWQLVTIRADDGVEWTMATRWGDIFKEAPHDQA